MLFRSVQIRASQRQNDGVARATHGKVADRGVTAPRMQCNHHIGFNATPINLDSHLVTQLAQHPGPTQSGAAIAMQRTGPGGCDECDFHGMFGVTLPTMTIADAHSVDDLIGLLDASRARTLRHVAALADNEWMGPYLTIVNPPLWEIGHLGWFHEHWCLRYAPGRALAPSLIENADARYNSALIAHADRWRTELPNVRDTLDYLARVQDAIRLRLTREGATPHLDYFVQLSVFHEDMHNEAFDCMRQTLGRPPADAPGAAARADTRAPGDAAISGGRFMLGAQPGVGFVFDNEKWAHPEIGRAHV